MPNSLLALVTVVLNGPNIKSRSSNVSHAALSLSQLLLYNSMKRYNENDTDIVRHSQQREAPLPAYLGVMLHTKTRKRELVDALCNLGLGISYDRVLKISIELGNNVCYYYQQKKVVCPPRLKGGIFTTAAVDNIDHNPSSSSFHDSFQGTGISLFQHPTEKNRDENSGVQLPTDAIQDHTRAQKKVLMLPEFYTTVPSVALRRDDPPIPQLQGPNKGECQRISEETVQEYRYSWQKSYIYILPSCVTVSAVLITTKLIQ